MGRQNESVLKAIGVLRIVAESANPMQFTEIQSSTGLAKSSLHSLLASLETSGMIRRGAAGYEIGLSAFEIGTRVHAAGSARGCAADTLDSLRSEWGEVCHFGMLVEGDVLYLDRRDSPEQLRYIATVGARKPAYATALGKAMLALRADNEIEDLYPSALPTLTESTLRHRDVLVRELAQVRTVGYAVEREESTPGVGCIGVATQCCGIVYGLSVSIPIYRMDRIDVPSMYPLLRRGIELFERTMSASVYVRAYVPGEAASNGIVSYASVQE